MSNWNYLIFTGVLLFLNAAAVLCLFVFKRHNDFLRADSDDGDCELPWVNLITAASFACAAAGMYRLGGGNAVFGNEYIVCAAALAAFFGADGFVPRNNRWEKTLVALSEIAALTFAVFRLPAPDFFAKFNAPAEVVKAVAAVAVWSVFKMQGFGGRNKTLTYAQILFVGMTLFLSVFITAYQPHIFLQTGGALLFVPMLALAPFVLLYGAEPDLSRPVFNLFNMTAVLMSAGLIYTGAWGCGVLLVSYPLFEAGLGLWQAGKNLMSRNKKPVFLFELLEVHGFSKGYAAGFAFKRNLLFCALVLLLLDRPFFQMQVVLICVLLYLKFAMNILNPDMRNATFRQLFTQIKSDARKSWRETNSTIAALKEKYKDPDKR